MRGTRAPDSGVVPDQFAAWRCAHCTHRHVASACSSWNFATSMNYLQHRRYHKWWTVRNGSQRKNYHGQRGAELPCIRQEVRLFEGIRDEEPFREQLEAQSQLGRERLGHLGNRRLTAEQVHRVLERTAAGEHDGVERAVGLEHGRRRVAQTMKSSSSSR